MNLILVFLKDGEKRRMWVYQSPLSSSRWLTKYPVVGSLCMKWLEHVCFLTFFLASRDCFSLCWWIQKKCPIVFFSLFHGMWINEMRCMLLKAETIMLSLSSVFMSVALMCIASKVVFIKMWIKWKTVMSGFRDLFSNPSNCLMKSSKSCENNYKKDLKDDAFILFDGRRRRMTSMEGRQAIES